MTSPRCGGPSHSWKAFIEDCPSKTRSTTLRGFVTHLGCIRSGSRQPVTPPAPGVTLLFTVSWQILLITFLAGFAVDRLLVWAGARRLPPFFSQLAGGAFITLVATGVNALGSHVWTSC